MPPTPKTFHCKNYNCDLLPEACIKRQKIATGQVSQTKWGNRKINVDLCADCEQGRKIIKDMEDIMNQPADPPATAKPTTTCKGFERECSNTEIFNKTHHLCRHCYWRMQAKKKRERKAAAVPKQIKKSPASKSLTLDFSDHPDLLKDIRTNAAEDFRTPEMQVLWMIMNFLNPKEKE